MTDVKNEVTRPADESQEENQSESVPDFIAVSMHVNPLINLPLLAHPLFHL